jgi:hypothetical protein
MALRLLSETETHAEAARALVEAYGMSSRQAYRYLHEAEVRAAPVAIPRPKIPFTVKLPEALVAAVRARAQARGEPLSTVRPPDLVDSDMTQAPEMPAKHLSLTVAENGLPVTRLMLACRINPPRLLRNQFINQA